MVRFISALVHAADRLEEAVPVLEEIAAEFKPNNGHSLRDTVNRMDRNIRANAANNVTLYRLIASVEGVDPGLYEELNELEDVPADEHDQ